MIEERRLPLIGENEVEPPIAIHVGQSDAFAHHRLCKTHFGGDVVVTAIAGADKERIDVVSTEIGARLKGGPESWVVNDPIVARAQGLQLRPAVDLAFDE